MGNLLESPYTYSAIEMKRTPHETKNRKNHCCSSLLSTRVRLLDGVDIRYFGTDNRCSSVDLRVAPVRVCSEICPWLVVLEKIDCVVDLVIKKNGLGYVATTAGGVNDFHGTSWLI